MQRDEKLVVMPYSQNGAQGDEIKIALNGWRKFCMFDYRFVIIGDFDESLRGAFPWVEFVAVDKIPFKRGQYTPLLDVLHKLDVARLKYGEEYTGFVRMMDDFYAIKPFVFEDVARTYYHSASFMGNGKLPVNFWSHSKWKTRQLLDKEGLPHVNYTTHHPCYFEFDKLNLIWDKYDMRNESYVFDDFYFNYFEHEPPVLDSKIRLGIWDNGVFKRDFRKAVDNPNIKFVCNSVTGWSKELETELNKITCPTV